MNCSLLLTLIGLLCLALSCEAFVKSSRGQARQRPVVMPAATKGRPNNNNNNRRNGVVITRIAPTATKSGSGSGLSKCEWAVVSCCSESNPRRRHQCFEGQMCMGAWVSNALCSPRFRMAVMNKLIMVMR